MLDVEEFWDDLLAYIEDGRVLPVVGEELLRVEDNGTSVALYRAVAERLLARYSIADEPLRDHHELNDAVCAIAARGKRVKDLYRPVHDILQKLLAEVKPPAALLELASVAHFDLFATATPDDLLARALNDVRFGGASQTQQIEYAPKLPTDRRNDIPHSPSSKYSAVFHLLGKADVAPFYAIHDEDALEFAYTLQAGNAPERIFSELRSRHVLLIGCNFGDWLNRFFLRLTNSERLFSDQRAKKEFFVGADTAADPRFTIFLERFSQDSRSYPVPAHEFVADLLRRWSERNPGVSDRFKDTTQPQLAAAGSAPSTIFISYSGDDIAAARRLFAGFQEMGGDVAWFDKSELKPGDDWEPRILSAIQRCLIFVPLLSANTENRTEGYFRLEWNEAAERSRRIQGRKFIFPVIVDPEFRSMSDYKLTPPQFQSFQYSHAPAGELTGVLRDEIREQLRALRGRARSL